MKLTRIKLPAVRAYVRSTLWALMPTKLHAMLEALEAHANADGFTAEEMQARVGAAKERTGMKAHGAIAVLPLHGVISQRMNMMSEMSGGTSSELFGKDFDAAVNDPDIGAIVLDIDSPGGAVAGTPELAAKVFAARGKKPIIAVANGLMASAAYWIGSAADTAYATPSSEGVGSIGVFTVHEDISGMAEKQGVKFTVIKAGKHKAEASPYEPLSAEAEEFIQGQVDEVDQMFNAAIAKHRGIRVADVRAGFGQGRAFSAKQALDAGMIDSIATLDDVLASLGAKQASGGRRAEQALALVAGSAEMTDVGRAALARAITETIQASVGASPSPNASTNSTALKARTDTVEDRTTAASGAAPQQDLATVRAAIQVEEGKRVCEINALCAEHGVSMKAGDFIARGLTVEQVGLEILKEKRTVSGVNGASQPIRVGMDREADRPFENLGQQLAAVAFAQSGGSLGIEDRRLYSAVTGAGASVGSDGGFAIQSDFAVDLQNSAYETGILASRCSVSEISGNADSLEVLHVDETSRATGSRWGGVQVYRGAEADEATAKKPKFGLWERRLTDLIGLYYATDRLLQDASALSGVAMEAFASEFGFKLDDEILNGAGGGECLGVNTTANGALVSIAKETGQPADTVDARNIQKMWARMPQRFRSDAAWFINADVEPELQNMQIGTGSSAQLVYMPPGGLSGSPFGTIYGRPVIPVEQCQTVGDKGDVLLAALKEYKLIRKGGLQSAESIHVKFTTNQRCFRWIMRVNGAPKWKSSVTPFKGSNALSPFVVIDARA